jgi:hypothetical protein
MDAAAKVTKQMRDYREAVERYTVFGERGDTQNAAVWRVRAAELESSIATALLQLELANTSKNNNVAR